MGKQDIIFILGIIFLSSFVAAAETHPQNIGLDITHSVRTNGAPTSTAICNITVFNPNEFTLVSFKAMTFNSLSKTFNYTVPSSNLSTLGIYTYDVTCIDGSLNTTDSFEFEISPTGKEYTISQSVTYFLIILIVAGLFGMFLWGAIKIPWKNERNQFNEITGINYKKYAKIFFMGMTYFCFVAILFLSWNISWGFLHLGSLATFFQWNYRLFWGLTPLIIPVMFVFAIVVYFKDRKLDEMIKRGLTVDGQ